MKAEIPVYRGVGLFDKNGNVTYFISLPKNQEGEMKVEETYNLDDKIIFVRIDNGREVEITNPNFESIELNFSIPAYTDGQKESYDVFIWHDTDAVGSTERAKAINDQNHVGPGKFGRGRIIKI